MGKPVFLLLVFLSTFAWPFFSLATGPDQPGLKMEIQQEVTETGSEMNPEAEPVESGNESSVNTTLLEDFLHETRVMYHSSHFSEIEFWYNQSESEDHSRLPVLPPKQR